jgi:hypothetical protein
MPEPQKPADTEDEGESFIATAEAAVVHLTQALVEKIGESGGAVNERRDLALQIQALGTVILGDTLDEVRAVLQGILEGRVAPQASPSAAAPPSSSQGATPVKKV